jgi:hypothetical protein
VFNFDLLKQARKMVAYQINQSPSRISIDRYTTKDNGFGVMVPDTSGTKTTYTYRVRISHERSGVQKIQEYDAGLDTSLSLWVLAPHTATLNANEVFTYNGNSYKILAVDALIKFGGVIAYQGQVAPA